MYGDNEELLGKWFKCRGRRHEIVPASKFGILPANKIDSSAENCKKSCEESLKRLGVESIDLCELLLVVPIVTLSTDFHQITLIVSISIQKHQSKRPCEHLLN